MNRRLFLSGSLKSLAGLGFLASSKDLTSDSLTQDTLLEKNHPVLAKVLGTAQDGGIPQIGCYCRNCQRAREGRNHGRLISSLAVLDFKEDKAFIIDATPDLRIQYDRLHERMKWEKTGRRNAPHGILLTHAHIGHYTGLMFYGYESQSTKQLPVYCSKKMARFLTDNGPWSQLVGLNNVTLRILRPGREVSLTAGVTVTPFQVPHRKEYSDTLGFRIAGRKNSLLYIPDIQSWDVWERSIIEEVKETDTALLDGTFFGPEELPGRDTARIGHPFMTASIELLKETVRRYKKRIFFTHLNHSNLALDPGGEPRRRLQKAGFDLASDGMEFPL